MPSDIWRNKEKEFIAMILPTTHCLHLQIGVLPLRCLDSKKHILENFPYEQLLCNFFPAHKLFAKKQ